MQQWLGLQRVNVHVEGLPCFLVCITVAEVVHVPAVAFQATGALLNSRQRASPVGPLHTVPVQPPRQRRAIWKYSTFPSVLQLSDVTVALTIYV